eukprot:Protomagalhaensia_sp_Gyna_25__4974@NODE_542_length_3167_cov_44_113491_g424_i0_p1_GENE_NODE_542_length_3167_cov_44_113491_g424_i0NODE_542_length_3167_cov_44_113491_g424_i0_p1_ORF_typecomplete_len461_score61_49ANAPC4_WD40/PF12894_7/21ANAPC4_WD40/PF12894_7/37ANAPC4_WD40/PF12894_7/0_025ANAPC4_WD40/PF12894_7/0_094WD40_like/PF17005_5/0_00079WD40_like/PF17005_5/0_12WD40_like/PF17005_5/4e03WD40/PF00400_32/37WD40/PF00400_32/8e03WD40/PF00400_32/46WD40/PF00400_32/0_21PQQ_2/PF13360_6/2_4PQQ_2/PF13360_6/0_00
MGGDSSNPDKSGQDDQVFALLDQIVFQRLKRKRPRPATEEQGQGAPSPDDRSPSQRGSFPTAPSFNRTDDGAATAAFEDDDDDSSTTAASPADSARQTTKGGWLERARQRRLVEGPKSLTTAVSAAAASSPESRKRQGHIRLDRLRDLTYPEPHQSRVTALDFISATAAFSTGLDKCIKLYQLPASPPGQYAASGQLEHSIHVKNQPITSAALGSKRSQIVCTSGSSNTVFTFDVESHAVTKCPTLSGRVDGDGAYSSVKTCDGLISILDDRGKIYLLDERTFKTVRVYNSGTKNQAITMTGNKIYSGDDGGEIFEWDLRLGRCSSRYTSEGSLGVRSLAMSSHQQLLVGTESGYVCLYSLDDTFKLVKSFGNLCTSVDCLATSTRLPLALAASSKESDAIRLFNLAEPCFVYQNFPGDQQQQQQGIRKVTCGAFSEPGGWMAVGNDRGVVKLWRLPTSL